MLRRHTKDCLKWITFIFGTFAVINILRQKTNIYTTNGKEFDKYVKIQQADFSKEIDALTSKNRNDQACVHPSLDINAPEIMKHYHSVPPVRCSEDPDWVTVEHGKIHISQHAKQMYGDIECKIRYLLRDGDFKTTFTDEVILRSSDYLELKHDFFTCFCETKDKKHHYENIHAGISYKQDVHQRVLNLTSGLNLDVLMIGLDSLSHMAYRRKLKKTYDYFTNALEGIVLNGYNIVGDGTPQALIPILTGKTELELPRTLKRLAVKRYCDIFPFIWKDFKASGYVTGFAEDNPYIGTFTYRMNGFNQQPTDHYMRPFYLVASSQFNQKSKYLCLGSKRRFEVFLDWIKDFYITYKSKPKFIFGFHSEISHENNNLAETGDEDLFMTLTHLQDAGYLNKTLLILMSDHGARFAKVRASLQGKQEERRPFFGFAFPKWFKQKYPSLIKHMKINVNRLSTPFDIYPTLNLMLRYVETGSANKNQRGVSLFEEIPKSRTCQDASVDSHWCACLKWNEIQTNTTEVNLAASSLLDHLNNLTNSYRSLCSEIKLTGVKKAFSLLPQTNLLKFKQSSDADGIVADLTDNTKVNEIKYQLWITTSPGNGLFEATVTHIVSKNTFTINSKDISRINKYGNDSKCIKSLDDPDLEKICYCKSNIS